MKKYQSRVMLNVLGMELWAAAIALIAMTHPGFPRSFDTNHPLLLGILAGFMVISFVRALVKLFKNIIEWRRFAALPPYVRWAIEFVENGQKGYVRH